MQPLLFVVSFAADVCYCVWQADRLLRGMSADEAKDTLLEAASANSEDNNIDLSDPEHAWREYDTGGVCGAPVKKQDEEQLREVLHTLRAVARRLR